MTQQGDKNNGAGYNTGTAEQDTAQGDHSTQTAHLKNSHT